MKSPDRADMEGENDMTQRVSEKTLESILNYRTLSTELEQSLAADLHAARKEIALLRVCTKPGICTCECGQDALRAADGGR